MKGGLVQVEKGFFDGADAYDNYGLIDLGIGLEAYPDLINAYLRLRTQVYVSRGIIDPSLVDESGVETDGDDERSRHYLLVRRLGDRAVTAACSRLIYKTEENDHPMPVEKFFHEQFSNNPAPVPSVEVSRLISQLPANREVMLKRLFYVMAARVVKDQVCNTYATAEEPLIQRLISLGVPVEIITPEPKMVEKYNSTNYAVRMDPVQLIQHNYVEMKPLEAGEKLFFR